MFFTENCCPEEIIKIQFYSENDISIGTFL